MTQKFLGYLTLVSLVFMVSLISSPARALDGGGAESTSPKVVISHILPDSIASTYHDIIELSSNSHEEVDVTDWCVYYYSSSNTEYKFCLEAEAPVEAVILPAGSHVTLASSTYIKNHEGASGNLTITANSLARKLGSVVLVDSGGSVVDAVWWGSHSSDVTGPIGQGDPLRALDQGEAIERIQAEDGHYKVTGVNLDDFTYVDQRGVYTAGTLSELIDYCSNIPLVLGAVPEGFYRDESTNECYEIPDDEPIVENPGDSEYSGGADVVGDVNMCEGVILSEVGANLSRQFIEIYNSSDDPVDLGGCILMTNRSTSRQYILPSEDLSPGGYRVVYIEDTNLTLTKTTKGKVYLLSSDSTEVDSVSYEYLAVDTSWALINEDDWRQTFTLTPGSANTYAQYAPCNEGYYRSEETGRCRKIVVDTPSADCPTGKERNPETNRCRNVGGSGSALVPCRAGQYRSPETNRCRSVGVASSSLVPCKPGQERNPETNRCRKVGANSAQLKPCKPGQERNPETNRCRKIGGNASKLKPCKPGQERNPDTNRCRNIRDGTVPSAAFAAVPVSDSSSATAGWWVLGVVAAFSVGYATWEWRSEVMTGLRRVRSILTTSK